MNLKMKKVGRLAFVSALLLVLVIGIISTPTISAQENDSTGKVDILVGGEDIGNKVEMFMTDPEGKEVVFSFTASGNLSEDAEVDVRWDFGVNESYFEPEVDTLSDALARNYSHTYQEAGSYNVTLIIESEGNSYQDEIQVIIEKDERGTYLTALGAGLAVGIAGMGAGVGVGIAGAAGAGTIAEKPDKFGKCLVFQALPQTQAIYGLLVAVLLLLFTGVLGAGEYVPLSVGLTSVGVGLAVGIAGLSAIGQGIAASGSMAAYAEKEELFGRGMVFSVLPETQAIYGLLIGILIMVFTGLLGGNIKAFMLGDMGMGLATVGVGAGLAVGVAGLSGIGQGVAAGAGIGSVAEREDLFGRGMVFSVLPETQAIYGMLIAILLMVSTGLLGTPSLVGVPLGLVGVGAGLAVGVAGLSGIGQGVAAASGIATVAEDESMFGRGMVFSVLPETQAIYGLLIAILLMVFSGILGAGGEATTMGMGIAAVGAGIAIGIAGVSGVGQGSTSGSAIAAVSKREETFGKGMIFSVMSETFAIFGLLIAIFIIVFLGFMG